MNVSPAVFILSSGISAFLVNSIMFFFLLVVCVVKYSYNSYLLMFVSLVLTLISLLTFSTGLALSLASLNVYVRDVAHVLNHTLNFAFYFTPILYTVDKAPKLVQKLLMLNPMTYFAQAMHSIVIKGVLEPKTAGIMVAISVLSFGMGFAVYKSLKEGFYDVL